MTATTPGAMETMAPTTLRSGSIGIMNIVFFVVAAAAPLTAIVGAAPLAYSLGNGAAAPSAYLLAGLVYIVFSVGFTAMSRYIGSAGAFYVFVVRGLGTMWGVAAGAVTLITYFAIQMGVYAFFGIVISGLLEAYGIKLPWWVYALACIGVVDMCGRRSIEFSGRILGVCMICEIVVLMILNLLILKSGGAEGISIAPSFAPANAFSLGLGVALLFAVASFIGFEATVIFAEEAKNPRRSIPISTYVAILVITIFYTFSAWSMVIAHGPSHIKDIATSDSANLFANTAFQFGGDLLRVALNTFLITSLFACVLAFHNTISRYLFAGGRERLLPARLAAVHPVFQSPHVACRWQSILVILFFLPFVVTGQDAYAVVYSWTVALSSIGILAVQILVGISVIGFFRSNQTDASIWQSTIAPAVSVAGLGGCLAIALSNLDLLTGSQGAIVWLLPAVIILTAAVGAFVAIRMRDRDSAQFARLGRSFLSETA